MPSATLSVAGLSVAVEAPAAWAGRVAEAVGQLGPSVRPGTCPDLRLSIRRGRLSALSPSARPLTQYGATLRVWGVGDEVVVRSPDGETALDRDAGTASLTVASDDPPAWERTVGAHLVVALSMWLRTHGRDPLHAAGLVLDGDAVLVVGPSDCGKSTLALALVRAGWGVLSDDTVLVYPDERAGGSLLASGFRRSFALDAGPALAGLHANAHALPGEEDKWSVDVDAAYPGRFAASAMPRLLLFPELTGEAESRFEALASAEAFVRLLAQSALRELRDAHTRRQHDQIGRLVAQAPALRLLAGRDLLHPDAADRHLRRVLPISHPS